MKMKNTSDGPAIIKELGLVVEAGKTVDIDDQYAKPGRNGTGSRKPSIIEMLAPQMRPASKEDEVEWLKVPETDNAVPEVAGPPTATDLIRQGVPAAVAEHQARRKRLEWEADQARKRGEDSQRHADAVEMEAAKIAAREEEAQKKHEDNRKEDEARRGKSAKEGQKRLKEEQDAEHKMLDAKNRAAAQAAESGAAAERVTLADVATQTGASNKQ